MKVNTKLDVDVVALEADDSLTLMIDLEAPEPAPEAGRPAQSLVVVLDRSGSMSRAMPAAHRALETLIDRLDPRDVFGVVAFDNEATLEIPAAPVGNMGKAALKELVRQIRPGGSTDLSAGYALGLNEASRIATPTGATVVLVSDGHANAGDVRPKVLGDLASRRAAAGITTATIGYGLGYDEQLLAAIAVGGSGNHRFAHDTDELVAAIAGEVTGLLSKSAVGVRLVARPSEGHVSAFSVFGGLPSSAAGHEVTVLLGDFYGSERRRVLLRVHVPSMATLGLAQVAEVELRFTALPELTDTSVTFPVMVNVVPGDVAAGRVPDPVVVAERLVLEAQDAKDQASTALRSGDAAAARQLLGQARTRLTDAVASAPPAAAEVLRREIEQLDLLDATTTTSNLFLSAKVVTDNVSSRRRGRERPE